MDTILPQCRVEKDEDEQLHDTVQKYSSGEISPEQYTCTLGFKYQTSTELWDYSAEFFYIKQDNILLKNLLPSPRGE